MGRAAGDRYMVQVRAAGGKGRGGGGEEVGLRLHLEGGALGDSVFGCETSEDKASRMATRFSVLDAGVAEGPSVQGSH